MDELRVLATSLDRRGGDESVFLEPPLQSDTKRLGEKQYGKMQSKGRDKSTPIDSPWNRSVGLDARTGLSSPQFTDSLTHGGHR